MKLSPQQRRLLMAEAQCDPRTLRNWIEKRTMKPTTQERIDAAAKKLKIKR